MKSNAIEISSLKIKFKDILNLVDNAIEQSKAIQIPKLVLSQRNNNIIFLKWLVKHKIIELISTEKIQPKKVSLRSRQRKIEISLQLKSLGCFVSEIAKRFNVKLVTAQSYLKSLGKYDKDYLEVLKITLAIKNITIYTSLNEFPLFPLRLNLERIRENLSLSNHKNLENIIENNKWLKFITGQNLGTYDLSILLPEK